MFTPFAGCDDTAERGAFRKTSAVFTSSMIWEYIHQRKPILCVPWKLQARMWRCPTRTPSACRISTTSTLCKFLRISFKNLVLNRVWRRRDSVYFSQTCSVALSICQNYWELPKQFGVGAGSHTQLFREYQNLFGEAIIEIWLIVDSYANRKISF